MQVCTCVYIIMCILHNLLVNYTRPYITDCPNYVICEGNEVMVPCEMQGNPPATVHWTYSNRTRISTDPHSRVYYNENGTLILSSLATIGVYRCVGTNVVGRFIHRVAFVGGKQNLVF